MNDIFAPMPPMESLESRIARRVARTALPSLPQPGHHDFVGPLRRYTQADFYDPRSNVPGVTYWGD